MIENYQNVGSDLPMELYGEGNASSKLAQYMLARDQKGKLDKIINNYSEQVLDYMGVTRNYSENLAQNLNSSYRTAQ